MIYTKIEEKKQGVYVALTQSTDFITWNTHSISYRIITIALSTRVATFSILVAIGCS